MATFNGIDYAVFILLFLSVAIGIARGFVKEVISLVAWVAAFVVSTLYAVKLATLLPGAAEQVPGVNPIESVSMVAILISYLVLFIGVLICGSIVKSIVNYAVEGSGLGWANRLFGAIFGLARGCVIVLLVMFFVAFTALATSALWKDSKLVAVFHPGVKWLNHASQPYWAQIEAKMQKTAKNLNQEDLSDVIKMKPANKTPAQPAAVVTVPATSAPASTVPAAAPAVPVKVPAASAPPAANPPAANPATSPETVPVATPQTTP